MAVAIILIYAVVQIYPSTFIPLNIFGYDKKIFYIGERVYSADLKLWSIFFATSPMLAISIAYYVHLAMRSYQKRLYILLALINIFAMFIAGTRNNMATSLLLPVVLLVLNLDKDTKRLTEISKKLYPNKQGRFQEIFFISKFIHLGTHTHTHTHTHARAHTHTHTVFIPRSLSPFSC
jgi:hypothetical protein